MSLRNEDSTSKRERRRNTNRVQLEENVFTTQISHYHQTMGYYSGVGPPFIPDRNCYNNINWSSRAPPWTGWTPGPPGTWLTPSVSNGSMVPSPQSFPCRVPNRIPQSPFNPPALPSQTPSVIDPLLGSMHAPASSNLQGWYARYPNDIPMQDVPVVVPSGQLDNLDCLRHVGNHIRADHNFVEKTLVQKCETTASVCGTTVTRRSWYKMPEKSPPQTTKEKAVKTNEKMEKNDVNIVEMAVLPSKIKKMEDTVILSPDYCSKLSIANPSSNTLPEVPNHNASSSNFTEYFLKRLMKKHQKESNMKKVSVSDSLTPNPQNASLQVSSNILEKRAPRIPISKNHIPNSHTSKISKRIIEDVIDLSRDSPPPTPASEPNKNNSNSIQKDNASCDLVITNSYSLSFSGVPNKTLNSSSLAGAKISPMKRKLPDLKPTTIQDNQKENLIITDSINDFPMKLSDGRSKRKKYEPRKRDSFVIDEDTSCWVSGTMNKLIDSNFGSNDKHVMSSNIIEKPLPSDQSNKYLNKMDSDNAPEYCDIVDILHSLSESDSNPQAAQTSHKEGVLLKKDPLPLKEPPPPKDPLLLERKVIQNTNSIQNNKCITLDDTDSDGTQSGETLIPCTVIRSRHSLDTISTADNSVDSLHDSTISSSSLDNNDILVENVLEKVLPFSLVSEKVNSKAKSIQGLNSRENGLSMLKKSFPKETIKEKSLILPEIKSDKEPTISPLTALNLAKPSVGKVSKAILPIKKQLVEHRISDEELETLEVSRKNNSQEHNPTSISKTGSKEHLVLESPSNSQNAKNDLIRIPKPHDSAEPTKMKRETPKACKIWNPSEKTITLKNDRLENPERASSVGNKSDNILPIDHSRSEYPVGSYNKIAKNNIKENAADLSAEDKINSFDEGVQDFSLAKLKLLESPDSKDNSIGNKSEPKDKIVDKQKSLVEESVKQTSDHSQESSSEEFVLKENIVSSESPKSPQQQQQQQQEKESQPQIESQQQETNSFLSSMVQVKQANKSILSKTSNIFTLTTSPHIETTTSEVESNKSDLTPIPPQHPMEISNASEKVPSSLEEINDSPCLEISENGDMKVIAIVTDYEESACDNLLGMTHSDNMQGKNSNVIVTPIATSKKDIVLEYSEHSNSSALKEFQKPKILTLTEVENSKNTKENGSLFSSFLNCHKDGISFSKNSNDGIVLLDNMKPSTKHKHSIHASSVDNQVGCLEAPGSTLGFNIMSVDIKQPNSTMVSMNSTQERLNCNPHENLTKKSKNSKKKFKKMKKLKNENSKKKTKTEKCLKKLKKQEISQKKRQSKKKPKSADSLEFQESLSSCNRRERKPISNLKKKGKLSLQPESKISSQTSLAKYELNILHTRISATCPDRRGRIFRLPPQDTAAQAPNNNFTDTANSTDKQCQTNNPFYGCLTHAFNGSCHQPLDRRLSSPIIHKFVKFHGHKLLCVIINVKKYVIVRELVQKCFQGKKQVIFYRTKYRDYSFPYLELPSHMKSFALKYLLGSGTLLTGHKATPLSIMLLTDAEIIYHFFYSFRECNLTACIQEWDPDVKDVYDHDWLKVLDVPTTATMKTEPSDSAGETGLPLNYFCSCNHTSNSFSSISGQCQINARKPIKRPMSGIFEPSFESPIFGTTSSSTQTSPSDIIDSSDHPLSKDDDEEDVSTKIIKIDAPIDPTLETSSSTISLDESFSPSNSVVALSNPNLMSISSNYCDSLSKAVSLDFSEKHRNKNDDNDANSHGFDLTTSSSSPFSSDPQSEESQNNFPLSDSSQTSDFVLGGMTLLEGKVVRFVEINGKRHFLLIDINSSWTFSNIFERLLELDIVIRRCSASQRHFLINLNHTLPQANADEMLLVADEFVPRLKTCLSLSPTNGSHHNKQTFDSKPETVKSLTKENQIFCLTKLEAEQKHLHTEILK